MDCLFEEIYLSEKGLAVTSFIKNTMFLILFSLGVFPHVWSTAMNCVFCKIINHEIPATIVKETEQLIVIKDLHPKAPIHYLIIPKKHRASLLDFDDSDALYSQAIFAMAAELGNELQDPKAFNLVVNNGKEAGQSVFHLHIHFLSGKNIYHSETVL